VYSVSGLVGLGRSMSGWQASGNADNDAPYSVVIIARDAATTIEGAIASVGAGIPVIVAVDSRTTDSTADQATALGAACQAIAWSGSFAELRNQALAMAPTDWVFFLDADEQMSPDLNQEIESLFRAGPTLPAYRFPRRNNLLGRWMKAGGWWPDRQVRLVNGLTARYVGAVHEAVDLSANSIGTLRQPISHVSHLSVADVVGRADEYARLEAQSAGGPRPWIVAIHLIPILRFLRRYFLWRGFMDGSVGLAEARLQAWYDHLTLVRRRLGPDAPGHPLWLRVLPADQDVAALIPAEPTAVQSPTSGLRDPISIGTAALFFLLPFHLVIKSVLPGPLGTDWKEAAILALASVAIYRLRAVTFDLWRSSWILRLTVGYAILIILVSFPTSNIGNTIEGLHVDLTYIPLAVVIVCIARDQGFAAIIWTTVTSGAICAVGSLIEVVLRRPLFPSQTLTQQYGNAAVYISDTHVLRPYFTFDFPTGLAAFLALVAIVALVACVVCRQRWYLATGLLALVGMTLTFSRGPWIGALAALCCIALVAREISTWMRYGAVVALLSLLVGSALVSGSGGARLLPARALAESSGLRSMPATLHHRQLSNFITDGQLVKRSGLPPSRGPRKITTWNVGAQTVGVLGEPPPAHGSALLRYRLLVPPNSALEWGVALDPRVWSRQDGDGVLFRLVIRDGGQPRVVFNRYIDPKNVPSDRRIFQFIYPLTGFSGELLTVSFITQCGPRLDDDYDWAGWISPAIVHLGTTSNLDAPPYRRVSRTFERPLKPQSIYLASVIDWSADQSNTDRVASWQRTLAAWRGHPLLGLGAGHDDEAAERTDPKHALVTESEIGKVLVESGSVGLCLWLALLALCLYFTVRGYLASRHWAQLVAAAGISCIAVTGLTFQILEVKQIAALFWAFVGVAIISELGVSNPSLRLAPWSGLGSRHIAPPVSGMALLTTLDSFRGRIFAWGADGVSVGQTQSAEPSPAPTPSREQPLIDRRNLPVSATRPAEPQKSLPLPSGVDIMTSVREVRVLRTQEEVNVLLQSGWVLLSAGFADDVPTFVVGRLPDSHYDG
jgi:(heptosyl)LPS beta-1,4-glucosyltransferase